MLCHQFISCWAIAWNSSSGAFGFCPMKRLTLSMNALRVSMIDSFGIDEGIVHLWALSCYAAAILSNPITQQLQALPAPWPIPYQGWVALWELNLWDTPNLCFK